MRIRRSIDFQSQEELERTEGLAKKAGLSLSNFLRKKLRLPKLGQGGARPNTGNRYCGVCKQEGRDKIKAWKDDLCEKCWHRDADAKAAMI